MNHYNNHILDVVGIGIGPFNLGFAALSHELPLKTLFFEQAPSFNWHPGLLIERSTLQVPFLADLVSSVDPTNPFSFTNYLKKKKMLFRFCIKETFYVTRKEYNDYCRWVADQLPELRFSHVVTGIEYHPEGYYEVSVHDLINRSTKTYSAKRLVVGTGTTALMPKCAEECSRERVFHSSQYLYRKSYLKPGSSISIIGSGQSAAEMFQDLLQEMDEKQFQLNWITAAERFFPMENSKLTFEHTSPDYLSYFHGLPEQKRAQIISRQEILYKGINQELIDEIYNELYHKDLYKKEPLPIKILPNVMLQSLTGNKYTGFELGLQHLQLDKDFKIQSDYVILATGYRHQEPAFLKFVNDRINRDESGGFKVAANFSVDKNEGEIYVLNAELSSHGILTSDLGMGPYRNARILNHILGPEKEAFELEDRIAFQDFGIPQDI